MAQYHDEHENDLATALPAASVSEPVAAWLWQEIEGPHNLSFVTTDVLIADKAKSDGHVVRPLYTHPAPSEPVSDGLVRFDGVTMTPAAAANRISDAEERAAKLEANAKTDILLMSGYNQLCKEHGFAPSSKELLDAAERFKRGAQQ